MVSMLLTTAQRDILQSQDRPHSPEDVARQWFVQANIMSQERALITS
jgi:hypothetical protein